jgi:hypothetical protein
LFGIINLGKILSSQRAQWFRNIKVSDSISMCQSATPCYARTQISLDDVFQWNTTSLSKLILKNLRGLSNPLKFERWGMAISTVHQQTILNFGFFVFISPYTRQATTDSEPLCWQCLSWNFAKVIGLIVLVSRAPESGFRSQGIRDHLELGHPQHFREVKFHPRWEHCRQTGTVNNTSNIIPEK